MKSAGVLCLLLCISLFVGAQTDSDPPKESKLPTVGIGDGVMIFSGDVGKFSVAEPLHYRNGLYLEVQKKSKSRTDVSLFFLTGKLYGNVSNEYRNLNFLSSITATGLNVRYHFSSNKEKILVPYISVGIEVLSFATKSDLYDANGNKYYFWQDGTIRSLDENDPSASPSTPELKRDYVYETDLKSANLDNRTSYPTNTLAFPVGAGFKFRLSDKFHIRTAFTYHLTNTNLIDGIDETGVGERTGSSKKDKFIFTYASLHFDLSGKSSRKANPKIPLKETNFDFASIPESDTDKDGVNDLADECPGTVAGIKVNDKGCPMDSDNDGIPDFRDKELNSAAGALVNEEGITMTEEFIRLKLERDSLNEVLSHQIEMLKAKDAAGGKKSVYTPDSTAVYSGSFDNTGRLPEDFRFIDLDKNGYISPAEMSAAIDDYLKDKSPLDRRRMHMLVDFFFDQ